MFGQGLFYLKVVEVVFSKKCHSHVYRIHVSTHQSIRGWVGQKGKLPCIDRPADCVGLTASVSHSLTDHPSFIRLPSIIHPALRIARDDACNSSLVQSLQRDPAPTSIRLWTTSLCQLASVVLSCLAAHASRRRRALPWLPQRSSHDGARCFPKPSPAWSRGWIIY